MTRKTIHHMNTDPTPVECLPRLGSAPPKFRAREFEVDNGSGLKPDIRIDPESFTTQPTFFIIQQDSESITVTLECLRNLSYAAQRLLEDRGLA